MPRKVLLHGYVSFRKAGETQQPLSIVLPESAAVVKDPGADGNHDAMPSTKVTINWFTNVQCELDVVLP